MPKVGLINLFVQHTSCALSINENADPDVCGDMEKMNLICFDPIHHGYIELGKRVGNAFADGKELK